ncbi:Non-specific serine/threonine protein kinase [Ascochyta rabiei]|uniref:Non-specific serine/threonine protein kinase n=1 Tax=Didymella rabiei TaxID=5454 RepID=UPI0021FC8A83|nr:Non-specific serine/threonine protein kinase [Ascochyta rabiei]UPX14348.1 Non-specific serine/threonine protein kinase [Ascochyta rabiei]
MARKGVGLAPPRAAPLTTNALTNGNSNGHPPPSTIAAQIVHNAANVNSRQDAAAKVTFGELLKEFLQHPNTDEPDTQLIAFICVVVEAGLEGLFKDDPFAQDQQREQGIRSVAAIIYLLRQKPHLLLSAKDSEDDGSPQPPVIIWLFPKLLGLLTHATLGPIHWHVQDLLSFCLSVLAQTSAYSRQAVATMQLYKSCVVYIRGELKAANDPVSSRSTPFLTAIPSSSSLNEFWPESKQFVAVPHSLQRTFTSPTAAIYVGLNLLMALCASTRPKTRKHTGLALFEQIYPWILDTCEELWHYFRRWTADSEKRPLHNEIVTLYMQLVDTLAIPSSEPRNRFASSIKAASASVGSVLRLVENLATSSLSDGNQIQLARMLTRLCHVAYVETEQGRVLDRRRHPSHVHDTELLKQAAGRICENTEVFSGLQKDLQLALCLWTSKGTWPEKVETLREELCSEGAASFTTAQLAEDATKCVQVFQSMHLDDERPAKRRKILHQSSKDVNTSAYHQLTMLLNGSSQESPILNLSNLHNIVQAKYSALPANPKQNEAVQEQMLSALGKIACAGSRCLEINNSVSEHWQQLNCTLCDLGPNIKDRSQKMYWDRNGCGEDWKEIIAALLAMTKEPKFQKSTKPRVLMAITIGRLFNHISDSDYLNLDACELGQWLLASLSRSLRELKIAATHALMVFLRSDINSRVCQKNRTSVVEFFDALAKRGVLADQETLILAYGQVARVCGELELPIILHRLVEYLGHPNALICGMAYRELDALAEPHEPEALFRPYWRILAFSVIKDIVNKPQKAQQLADLTEQTVRQLLVLTQAYTLPHLVLTKRRDVVEKIAQARKVSVAEVLTQPRNNLAKILALLLSQSVPDVESHAMETLAAIEPAIREGSNNKLEALIALDITGVAIEILMLSAERDESKKAPYHRAFSTLARLADTKNAQRRSSSKTKNLDEFCETHILGIIAYFSDIVESPLTQGKTLPHPLPERKRCIAAIGDFISLARYSVNGALPQIRACLQSAMADPDLCDDAFLVWSAFLNALDADDTMLVVDQTFALILQHWAIFSEETQLLANKTVVDLTQEYDTQLRSRIEYLPSLATIPMMSKTEAELVRFKSHVDTVRIFQAFGNRCKDQNSVVVRQALRELGPYLDANQKHLHQAIVGQKPLPVLAALTRSLLDASVRFSEDHPDITTLCAQCLGIIGGLDPYRIETVREKKRVLMLSNFSRRDEDIDFVALLLEQVLVKVFLSTTNATSQGWIAYVMQEMLKHCGFSALAVAKPRSSQAGTEAQRWNDIPEPVRNVLTPFLNSRYSVNRNPALHYKSPAYPIFNGKISHGTWLQTFVYDLLQKGQGVNVEMVFPVLARVIRGFDLSIATFILPFAALNVIVSDNEPNMVNVGKELLTVLQNEIHTADQTDVVLIKQCSENVFQTLDYLSLWLQEKKKSVADARIMAGKTGRGVSEEEEMNAIKQISRVEGILQLIPAEVISRRAVECGSYARALFHWEQYYRQQQQLKTVTNQPFERDDLLQHLQSIYAQIDEPDSIEGITAHLRVLNPEQQIMEDRKAGRWTAAQSWYEIALAEKPDDLETQVNLLTCLKESGQYDAILNYVDGFHASNSFSISTLPFAAEAAWSAGKWTQLERILGASADHFNGAATDFNVGVGRALLALYRKDEAEFKIITAALRGSLAKGLSPSNTNSLQACHDTLVKLHALYEIEAISGVGTPATSEREIILENLDRRLDVIGAYTSDKQYLLGIRRATMLVSKIDFSDLDIASAWLTTGRLARKGGFMTTAFNSVLHADQLGDGASKIEYSKLLWKEGHHRKAIQNLRGAIDSNAFQNSDSLPMNISITTDGRGSDHMSKVKCHAQLLLAKWLDRAGQTKSGSLKDAYATGVMSYPKWDKGHYYLGRYYLKLLESEKKLPVTKQSQEYLAGSLIKLVIENFVRSTVYGTKYYYQTLPKILTLWLDLGTEVMNVTPRSARDKEFHDHRLTYLDHINKYLKRYAGERMPAYTWYTAFPQIITRISHPNKNVWDALQSIIIRVAAAYPQQTLWSLLAVLHSTQDDRRARGTAVLQKLRDTSKRKNGSLDLKNVIVQGQRLTDALLVACDAPVEQRATHVSLSKDLAFSHKLAPSQLVVPIEANMLPNLPSGNDSKTIRLHNPFPQDAVTINAFMDDVLVLSSLQRPRKINVRGSDGRSYGLLCKPKDDLRKDQRLMEFNAMINRALQKDIESSKRRLYIKTYAVTPLNEECGAIEWVEGLKPMRDIIIRFYRQHNVHIDYSEIRTLLNEASSSPSKVPIFTKKILGKFQPVLHEWFVETFPEPEAWLSARLRYTRSCAVMSIVGHVLGLGDRHGENVLLEQGDGGTFHVDFNCLFDKGLTFEKPELVPFRLTHNMVDAMGPQGVEGPFRKAAELVYSLLRQHEDTLITILETFVHDPTADFLGGKRRKKIAGVPDTPQEVLDSVRTKVNGYLKGESVPLSVEGYVDALIAMAKDPVNLAAMYIGWCAFF